VWEGNRETDKQTDKQREERGNNGNKLRIELWKERWYTTSITERGTVKG